MSTASDLIKSSLRKIGVLATGETPEANQSIEALAVLNAMIKSWNIQGLLVFKSIREEFALVSGQASRTVGATGNFVTTRPTRILRMGVESNGIEYPVEIINMDQYAAIANKAQSAENPTKVYIEGTYPNETLNFWPVPSSTNNLVIYSDKAISSTLELADTLSFPDGYEDALEYNLSVRLAPEYGRQLDPIIFQEAQELKAQLIRQNTKPVLMNSDAPNAVIAQSFNVNIGE